MAAASVQPIINKSYITPAIEQKILSRAEKIAEVLKSRVDSVFRVDVNYDLKNPVESNLHNSIIRQQMYSLKVSTLNKIHQYKIPHDGKVREIYDRIIVEVSRNETFKNNLIEPNFSYALQWLNFRAEAEFQTLIPAAEAAEIAYALAEDLVLPQTASSNADMVTDHKAPL